MKIPQLPDNLSLTDACNIESEFAELIRKSPDCKRMATLIARRSISSSGKFLGTIPKHIAGMFLYAASGGVDGFSPYHMKGGSELAIEAMLSTDTPLDRKEFLGEVLLSHPDIATRKNALPVVKFALGNRFEVAKIAAQKVLDGRHLAGIDDGAIFEAQDMAQEAKAKAQAEKAEKATVKAAADKAAMTASPNGVKIAANAGK